MTIQNSATIRFTGLTQPGGNSGNQFLQDIIMGLSRSPKQLPSKYFYDAEGSHLFQQIMHLPEYYLTRCEHELLQTHQKAIVGQIAAEGPFQLIDLGAGDALKTKILLRQLAAQQVAVEYVPVDISGDALKELCTALQQEMPAMPVHAIAGDYFTALDWLNNYKPGRKVLLFLGSNIGNFAPDDQVSFLKKVRASMRPKDLLLMGTDLHKDPEIILKAYDDASGVTAAFNLNLLHRMNRELGADIQVGQFRHFALYNPQQGVMQSFLVSQVKQTITLKAASQAFTLQAWEAIHTENSCKFTLEQVQQLGATTGFKVDAVYQDKNNYFADILYAPN
ncbi:L-histidine N(alpha)-methyltransferase [Pontibacter burrus]|uniref:L-histidine N(Alpha)-methyltransferase n=1 Tax=Pontibacter burrus TaxID=2704466 RepID=A0A6B3LV46_9BACT|nr:L-histidine N(alpha)-methyltransferase [Pontibacter burrus]NEM97808.1 L-histidine N(alpha)-methyltransferase [Pontibacter burrus]